MIFWLPYIPLLFNIKDIATSLSPAAYMFALHMMGTSQNSLINHSPLDDHSITSTVITNGTFVGTAAGDTAVSTISYLSLIGVRRTSDTPTSQVEGWIVEIPVFREQDDPPDFSAVEAASSERDHEVEQI